MDRTFVICKPDAVARGLVGEILGRLEAKGLRLVALDLRTIDVGTAEMHYEEHRDRRFFGELVTFITSGPSVVLVAEGPEDTWKVVRTLIGSTHPAESPPGTIRGDFGTVISQNLVHGSDGPDSASREIELFFPSLA